MSYEPRRMSLIGFKASALASAALLGSALLLNPLAASADPMSPETSTPAVAKGSMSPHHGHAARGAMKETVEQRITRLHTALKITPSEEADWTTVAQTMRDNEAKMQKLVADRKAEAPHPATAVEDLKTYETFTQAHVDGLKALISSFETLYNTMPDSQKQVSDGVFQKFSHREHRMTS